MVECVYCGEAEAAERIMSPNGDIEVWNVCKDCKDVIKEQQRLAFGEILIGLDGGSGFGEKMVAEASEKLNEIAKRTKIPSITAGIFKGRGGKHDSASVVFTGEAE